MSDTSLGFNLIGRDVSASRALRGVGDQAQRTSGTFAAMGRIAGGVFGGFALTAGIAKVADFMRDAAAAAIEDERTVVALATAMDNLGLASQNTGVEKFIEELMLATGVADDELRPAFQKLVTATKDVDKAQKLLQASLDLSAAGLGSVDAAATALAKASSGNIGALQKFTKGALDPATVASKDFAVALDDVTAKFGGQAAAAAETYGGKMKRLSAAVDEAKETIGYAMLNAIDDVAAAFSDGGDAIGGFQDSIAGAGQTMADMVTGTGVVIRELVRLKDVVESVSNFGMPGMPDFLSEWGIIGGSVLAPLKKLGEYQRENEAASHKWANEFQRLRDLGMGWAADLGYVNQRTGELDIAAGDAAAALDELRAAQTALNDALNAAEGRLAFQRWLRDLDGIVAKNTTSFEGFGKGVRKNQDAIIEGFGLAEAKVKSWSAEAITAAGGFEAAFAGVAAKTVKQFVADGFELKDIRAFLKSQGLWSTELAAVFAKEKHADAYAKAFQLGAGLGKDLSRGLAQGIVDGTPGAAQNAKALVEAAERAARAAAESSSPSKVFMRVGEDLGKGLAEGIKKSDARVAEATESLVDTAKTAAVDGSAKITAAWDEVLGASTAATDAVTDWVANTSKALMTINLGDAWKGQWDSAGKATGISLVQGFENQVKQQQWFQNVLIAIKGQGGSDALIAEIMSKGASLGGSLGQGILDQGLVKYFTDNLQTVTNSATTTAQAIVPEFLLAGAASAAATLQAFVMQFGQQGPARTALLELMDGLARDMSRTVSIDVQVTRTVTDIISGVASGIAGSRAGGGPVVAGGRYLVGEHGPEIYEVGGNGFVTPNDKLGGRGEGGLTVNVYNAGSVITERDLAVSVRDGMAQLLRRRGLSTAALGV